MMGRLSKFSQAGKDILYSFNIGGNKLGTFMATLRDFGMEVREEMNKTSGTSNEQFVVACLASPEEIKDKNFTMIETAENSFLNMKRPINLRKRYFTTGRVAVIMNVPYWHGEARLLDPTGEIWRSITNIEDTETIDIRRSFLNMPANIMKDFQDTFQNVEAYKRSVLIVYSHLIPCTNQRHECARLIANYAMRNKNMTIIVRYDVGYHDTNTKVTKDVMTKCSNIYLASSQFRTYMNHEVYQKKRDSDKENWGNIKSEKWRTHAKWSHDEEVSFRKCNRINWRNKYKGTKKAGRQFVGRPIKSKPKVRKGNITEESSWKHVLMADEYECEEEQDGSIIHA